MSPIHLTHSVRVVQLTVTQARFLWTRNRDNLVEDCWPCNSEWAQVWLCSQHSARPAFICKLSLKEGRRMACHKLKWHWEWLQGHWERKSQGPEPIIPLTQVIHTHVSNLIEGLLSQVISNSTSHQEVKESRVLLRKILSLDGLDTTPQHVQYLETDKPFPLYSLISSWHHSSRLSFIVIRWDQVKISNKTPKSKTLSC